MPASRAHYRFHACFRGTSCFGEVSWPMHVSGLTTDTFSESIACSSYLGTWSLAKERLCCTRLGVYLPQHLTGTAPLCETCVFPHTQDQGVAHTFSHDTQSTFQKQMGVTVCLTTCESHRKSINTRTCRSQPVVETKPSTVSPSGFW